METKLECGLIGLVLLGNFNVLGLETSKSKAMHELAECRDLAMLGVLAICIRGLKARNIRYKIQHH